MRRTLKFTALIATLFFAVASPALAHGDEEHTGPFRVVVKKSLPEKAVSVSVENGSLTLTVTPGHAVSVLGYDDEESIRIDSSGVIWTQPSSMMAQMAAPVATASKTVQDISEDTSSEHSHGMTEDDMTHMEEDTTTGMASPSTYTESPESNWKKIGDGGIVLYHEHRCHFMGTQISQSIATGGRVASFDLPFLVDGEKFSLTGDLIFDPSMDPQKAAELLGGAHEHSTTTPVALYVALALVATGIALLLLRKATAASKTSSQNVSPSAAAPPAEAVTEPQPTKEAEAVTPPAALDESDGSSIND